MAMTTHVVRQRPPLRGLVLAAGAMLAGAVLMLISDLLTGPVALTLTGLTVLVIGGVAFCVPWFTARSMRVEVVLDENGYRITGAGNSESGDWSDITKVTRGEGRITFHRRDGARVQLVMAPNGRGDLDALGDDIARRLDADRGYS